MTKPINRPREYVSGRISNEIMAIVIFFTFVAAILNISISPRVPFYLYTASCVSPVLPSSWDLLFRRIIYVLFSHILYTK